MPMFEELAFALAEEFEADGWGDIDPDLFRHALLYVNDPKDFERDWGDNEDVMRDVKGMVAVLERVTERINGADRRIDP